MIPNRVVLDTNVCLDLFVFRDPRRAPLHAALREGRLVAVTRHDCRTEWILVLNYTHFGLSPERRSACIAEFDALIVCQPLAAANGPCAPRECRAMAESNSANNMVMATCLGSEGRFGSFGGQGTALLPHCSDGDDQKFLETARDWGASLLITKDKALLKLAARCRRAGLFDIQKPETWTAALGRGSGLPNS